MSVGLIIAGGGLAALAAGALMLRRHREDAGRLALAARHGWEPSIRPQDHLLAHLRSVALLQIGHSRRIPEAFRTDQPTCIFPYVFETGFEERRRSHHWLLAASETTHSLSRATITRYDWLIATASGPATRVITLDAPTVGVSGSGNAGERSRVQADSNTHNQNADVPTDSPPDLGIKLVAIVEDEEAWRRRLVSDLARWFIDQPPSRSWEILPGLVVGYEPGRPEEKAMVELEAATRALAGGALVRSGRYGR